MKPLSRLAGAFAELLFPLECAACGSSTALRRGVCAECWNTLPALGPSICAACGRSLPSPEPGAAWRDYKCRECRIAKRMPYRHLRSLFRYAFPLRELVRRFKFEGMINIGEELGALLADAAAGLPRLLAGADLVTPVPLHPWRRFQRGFNQSAVLALAVAKRLNLPLREGALLRLRNTPPQSTLESDQRRRNLRGVFTAAGGIVKNAHVVLIDDVVTTEGTIRACASALKGAGAKVVTALTVARAENP